MIWASHLQGQTGKNNDVVVLKNEIVSIVKIINAYPGSPFLTLEGISIDGAYKAQVIAKPGTELVQKIICTYIDDSTKRKMFFYDKDMLLRADFKTDIYYSIGGRIVNQEGSFVDAAEVKDLVAMGLWLCKVVGKLR